MSISELIEADDDNDDGLAFSGGIWIINQNADSLTAYRSFDDSLQTTLFFFLLKVFFSKQAFINVLF